MSVSVTFHLMYVKIIFSSVLFAVWPPFGKKLHVFTRLNLCSLHIYRLLNVYR